jgi:hypothetical protein
MLSNARDGPWPVVDPSPSITAEGHLRMTRFAVFGALYMTALFLEPAEKWYYPAFTTALLLLGVALVAAGLTRRTLPLFLVAATAHFLLVEFPDVANHVNVEIYVSLLLMVGIAYSLVRRERFPTDDDCFELVRPVLQASMILIYALAGFDKLNTDFINPEVSCVGSMIQDLTRVAKGHALGVPYAALLVVGVGLAVVALVLTRRGDRAVPPTVKAGALGLVLLLGVLATALAPRIPSSTAPVAVMMMAGVVILWEFVGGLLLGVPRFQGPLLAFSWMMHATLSLIGFVHFGALAFAMLFTFVPGRYLDLMTGHLRVSIVGRTIPRVHAYLGVSVLAGICSGLGGRLVAAALFNIGVLILTWPMLRELVAQAPRPIWPGVSLRNGLTPLWMFGFPVLLLLHGLTSYVGLRTAGNFSMFSNLRTEGPRSNHLLLAGNPLKVWEYQEDLVRLIRIDDSLAATGFDYKPLQGYQLPVVEFRKWIYAWTKAGKTIPITLEYRGQVHSTENIVNDPRWRTSARDWEMRLMDFRVVQPDGANRCRW